MFRTAIVGCGTVSEAHVSAIENSDFTQITACVDPIIDRAEAIAQTHNASVYPSLEALLDHEPIDVIHLCTPHGLHTPMVLMAAQKGVHVFTEKPPCINRTQWDMVVKASKRVHVGICFQNRYNQAVSDIRSLLAEETLGEVEGVRAFVTWHRDDAYYHESPWRGKLAEAGGGALINQAIHTLDLMVYLLGKPENVVSSMTNHHLEQAIEIEDTLEAYMTFQGKPGLFYASTAFCCNAPVFLEINCKHGLIRMEKNTLAVRHEDGKSTYRDYDENQQFVHEHWGNAHWACIDDFYMALLQKQPPPIGVEQIADTLDTMLKIYECRGMPGM